MDPNSLRLAEINRGLMDASNVIDMKLPEAGMLETVKARRARLRPLLKASTARPPLSSSHSATGTWIWNGCGRWPRPSARWLEPCANQLA